MELLLGDVEEFSDGCPSPYQSLFLVLFHADEVDVGYVVFDELRFRRNKQRRTCADVFSGVLRVRMRFSLDRLLRLRTRFPDLKTTLFLMEKAAG